jgi:hypothetical protein
MERCILVIVLSILQRDAFVPSGLNGLCFDVYTSTVVMQREATSRRKSSFTQLKQNKFIIMHYY